MLKPTVNCGELRVTDKDREVVLAGWVSGWRDHGGVVFIDLRDFHGKTQVVFGREKTGLPEKDEKELIEIANSLRNEYVIAVKGIVNLRPEGTRNDKLPTGEIEISARQINLINECAELPFDLKNPDKVGEETRLKYRYLEMRSGKLKESLALRHRFFQSTRNFFADNGFIEVETPFLTRSTPEGARDFLVPSRINPGKFYALPQSPQLFKQLLMIGGIGKYFQIVKCFRDEDLRQDRQPEFTQLDLEMSFIDEEDIKKLLERYIQSVFREVIGVELEIPFKRLSYSEAMDRYGTDKPDLRIPLEIINITDLASNSSFKVFSSAASCGVVKGLKIPDADEISLSVINKTTEEIQSLGAKGLAWMRHKKDGLHSPITKFFSEEELKEISSRFDTRRGDIIFFIADTEQVVGACLDYLRRTFGKPSENVFMPLWIEDYPLFEKDDAGNPTPMHHPFTSPRSGEEELLEKEPFAVKSKAYDMVLNGAEIGGGSIRIHSPVLQNRVFKILNITEEKARQKFGFLLQALSFGAPPHGGFAFGVDRLVACMLGINSIREVIPFPKTRRAYSPLTGSPSDVDKEQLDEIGIRIVDFKKD